nr:uncharacterized protein LOC111511482 [Leptinotarsa decemlineata]
MALHWTPIVVFAALIHFSASRAVNISNTWMLPEEGFPVFYRYFRDRISWYEADAVCQFHHAYLVTADSSSEYDAIRAYLKELDITDNVWIGLSKIPEKPNFTWTNSQPLSGEGHWQETISSSSNPLCVAMDPAKDFLWKPMTCGGPEVASFICELPIPSWALGPRGCLLTELPSLTVLYVPEQSSLELMSDCGLDGTKRIACKGDADREEILKQLTCAIPHDDFEDKSTKLLGGFPTAVFAPTENSAPTGRTMKTPIWTLNTIEVDNGMPTRHRRETEDTLIAGSTESTAKLHAVEKPIITQDTYTATNYDTEMTTSNLPESSAAESTSLKISSSETPPEAKTVEGVTTDNVTPIIEVAQISTTVSSNGQKGSIDKDISAEYPSAISQGQLFSIIENGTMFDIIELNATSDRDLKTLETSTAEQKTEKKPSTKLTQLSEKNQKKYTDSKNKPASKKDIYKMSDPKNNSQKKPYAKTEAPQAVKDISKEVEIFPVIHDSSLKLNRTFRKEVPMIRKETQSEDNVNTTETNKTKKELETEPPNKIDPNIDALNTNLKANNDSEIIEDFEIKIKQSLKKQLEPNSLQDEVKNELGSEITEEPVEIDETAAQQKPNRQRQLTRPQRRPFYPYFFSRVLG